MPTKKIKKLPANVISKIAAGEVVERPVSIVKELIENAIDAESTKISIEIAAGGVDFIIISDNGVGIDKSELSEALTLHATSKLQDISDLEDINTLGFRGEALASISAVTDIEIISKSENESTAHKINDDDQIPKPASRSQGTTIKVKNLFRKIPARKKFLKSERSEEKKIRELIKFQALNFPEIEFKYTVDGREVFDLKKSNLKSRISELFKISDKDLIQLDSNENININGYVTHPREGSKRPTQFITINGRVIKDNMIAAAVRRGFGNRLPVELKPNLFLNIKIAGEFIDVNIHPRKEEVKFSSEKTIFKEVLKATESGVNNMISKEFASKFSVKKNSNNSKDNKNLRRNDYPVFNQQARPQAQGLINSSINFSEQILKPVQYEDRLSSKQVKQTNTKYSKDSNYNKTPEEQTYLNDSTISEFKVSQLFATYILVEKANKLLIVDQHAAAERINYEKLKQDSGTLLGETPLLLPQEITISEEISNEVFEKLKSKTKKFGIKITKKTDSEPNKLMVESMPIIIATKKNPQERIQELLDTEIQAIIDGEEVVSDYEAGVDYEIARLACHSSIRAGEILSDERMVELINSLENCDNPHTCPHGRPTYWELSRTQIEKNFMRIKA